MPLWVFDLFQFAAPLGAVRKMSDCDTSLLSRIQYGDADKPIDVRLIADGNVRIEGPE